MCRGEVHQEVQSGADNILNGWCLRLVSQDVV